MLYFEEKQNTVKIDTYDLFFDEKSFWKSISNDKGIQSKDLMSGESNMYPALLVHNDKEYRSREQTDYKLVSRYPALSPTPTIIKEFVKLSHTLLIRNKSF